MVRVATVPLSGAVNLTTGAPSFEASRNLDFIGHCADEP